MIASGNHLLTQVKDNQPSLRRRLELGVAGRKPSGSAKTETTGRSRSGAGLRRVADLQCSFSHCGRSSFDADGIGTVRRFPSRSRATRSLSGSLRGRSGKVTGNRDSRETRCGGWRRPTRPFASPVEGTAADGSNRDPDPLSRVASAWRHPPKAHRRRRVRSLGPSRQRDVQQGRNRSWSAPYSRPHLLGTLQARAFLPLASCRACRDTPPIGGGPSAGPGHNLLIRLHKYKTTSRASSPTSPSRSPTTSPTTLLSVIATARKRGWNILPILTAQACPPIQALRA